MVQVFLKGKKPPPLSAGSLPIPANHLKGYIPIEIQFKLGDSKTNSA